MSAEEIAKAFTQHYYRTFDENPANLANLFTNQSMMTFENQQYGGQQNIIQKLTSVGKVVHHEATRDVQPSVVENAILVFVTGNIRIGGPESNPVHFTELFQLVATQPGQYYIHNNVFRLQYG